MDKDKDQYTEEIEEISETERDNRSSGVGHEKVPDASDTGDDHKTSARSDRDEAKPKKKSKKPKKLTQKDMVNRLEEKNHVLMELKHKFSNIEDELKSTKDKWMRSVADFENYRKRSQKEWELLKQQSKGEIFLEVLNVVDDFERAFSVVGERDDEFVEGIRLIYNNLLVILNKFGVTPMEALHTPFDPNYHMAIGQFETEEVESNHVVEVVQKGYLLDDSVLRPARVIVAK